jgi:hypothetical protein
MDLTLDPGERALIAQVGQLLAERSATQALDRNHWAALDDGGLLEDLSDRAGVLGAVLAVVEAARLGSLTPLGIAGLVLPLFSDAGAGRVAAIADVDDPHGAPVRYGADADLLIRYEGPLAQLYEIDPAGAQALQSQYVYPLAIPAPPAGPPIATAPAEAVLARHRLAIAAEAVGAMDSVLWRLCAHLTGRRQFNRPLGAFQAIQHRLAELAIDLEMARWMVNQAGWDRTAASAALAAAYAARRARRFVYEAHQLAGTRGFTLELGLSFDTLRLQALSIEAGGAKAHERDAYGLIWAKPSEAAAGACQPQPTGR